MTLGTAVIRSATLALLLGGIALSSRNALAHPISLSECEVRIGATRATATLTIFLEDLYLFHDLTPNAANYLSAAELRRGIGLHQKFIAERFILRDGAGQRIQATAAPAVPFQLPPQGVALPELMTYRLQFRMDYDLPEELSVLSIGHTLSGDGGLFPAEMKLTVRAANTSDALVRTITSGGHQSIRLKWPASDVEPSHESRPLVDATGPTIGAIDDAGAKSVGAVYSFLYLEDYEVRQEILIPLMALEESLPLTRRKPDQLSVAEQTASEAAIVKLLRDQVRLRVNGRDRQPVQQRLRFVGLSVSELTAETEPRSVSVADGRAAIILRYPLTAALRSVQLDWNLFSPSVFGIQHVVFREDQMDRSVLTYLAGRNRFEWRSSEPPPAITIKPITEPSPVADLSAVAKPSPLNSEPSRWLLPWTAYRSATAVRGSLAVVVLLSLLLAGRTCRRSARSRTASGMMVIGCLIGVCVCTLWLLLQQANLPDNRNSLTVMQQQQIRRSLLTNLYQAFRFRDEQQIYDAIAISCDDGLAQQIYLQLVESLKMTDQGGAVARIQSVVFDRLPSATTDRQAAGCRWVVAGTVEHWGHIHERKNRFDALVDVAWIDGAWKLTGLNIVDQNQIAASTVLRKPSE